MDLPPSQDQESQPPESDEIQVALRCARYGQEMGTSAVHAVHSGSVEPARYVAIGQESDMGVATAVEGYVNVLELTRSRMRRERAEMAELEDAVVSLLSTSDNPLSATAIINTIARARGISHDKAQTALVYAANRGLVESPDGSIGYFTIPRD